MSARAEAEQTQPGLDEVKTIPQTIEIPEHIEKGGVTPVQHQVTAQVTDDSGQPLIQSPATQNITVQIPATDDQLTDWSKGDISESLTWYGMFWLRIKLKALALGKKISIVPRS